MSDLLVLCYHAVSHRWPADLSIHPDLLERQLRSLVDRGYRGATFAEALQGHDGPTVVVTFDDAFSSVLTLAKPILDRLELAATVFVPTDFADRGTPLRWAGIDHWTGGEHEAELQALSWPELRALAEAGWEVGSHTRSHPRLTALDDRRLEEELRGSREACERELGQPCASVAYPYGDVDDRVSGAARAAGYAAGAALPLVWHRASRFQVPRVGVYHGDRLARFRLKVSPLARRVRVALRR